jgi:hypothetical protein
MAVFHIPMFVPLIWAILVTIFWRYKFGDPVNHWLVCILVFAVNFFFFTFAFIAFFSIAIFDKAISRYNNRRKNNGL